MIDSAERRKALYAQLNEVVEGFTALENDEAADGVPSVMAVAHVLIVGTDTFAHDTAGSVSMYPAGGLQTGWKTGGIINMARAYLEGCNCG